MRVPNFSGTVPSSTGLFKDDDSFAVGDLVARAWHTPGQRRPVKTYLIGDAAFVGDTLFMPDSGTARVDFPGGDAHTLYQSIQRVLSLPDSTRLFLCHDYGGEGRGFREHHDRSRRAQREYSRSRRNRANRFHRDARGPFTRRWACRSSCHPCR